jgi:hypothetical protein
LRGRTSGTPGACTDRLVVGSSAHERLGVDCCTGSWRATRASGKRVAAVHRSPACPLSLRLPHRH